MDGCFHLSPDRVSIYPLSPSTHTGLEAMPLVYLEMLILLCCLYSDDLLAPVMSLIWARRGHWKACSYTYTIGQPRSDDHFCLNEVYLKGI